MGYPVGPLLQELAQRILSNLEFIEDRAPTWGTARQDAAPFADTQLLVSLLGVLVFPAERNSAELGKLLASYGDLRHVVDVVWTKDDGPWVEITTSDGEAVRLDPKNIRNLPQLLRNSIAHFNMRPIDVDGRFGGVRVWNRDLSNRITFIADVHFDPLRRLARTILGQLASGAAAAQLDDPPDPYEEALSQPRQEQVRRKPPQLNDVVWQRWLDVCGGDADKAHQLIVATLNQEAKRLLAI